MAGWRLVQLGEVLRLRKDVVHPRNKPSGLTTFVGLEHIESVTGRRIGSLTVEMSQLTGRKPQFRESDIVYGYLRPYLNKVWVAKFDGLCSVDQYVYEVNGDLADADFVAWFMRSPTYLHRAPIDSTPGQLPRIRTEEVASVQLELPPLAEQRRIAGCVREQLVDVGRARAAVKAQLEAARLVPDAMLRGVFDGPEARQWPRCRLGDVAAIVSGIQKCPDRAPARFHKQFLTVRNVKRGFLDLSRIERFEVTPAEFERCRLQRNDILIVEGNGSVDHIGRNALFTEDGEWIHQNHIIRVRLPPHLFVPEFVSLFLNSTAGRMQMLEKAKTTTGLYTLSTGKVASLDIPAPVRPEQTAIAERLTAETAGISELCCALNDKLVTLDHLPSALLSEAFRDST